jgi:predicted signal transduction protein with EAL and GGDEF domain
LRAWAATNFVVVVEPSAGARAEAIAQGIVQSLGEPFSTDRGVAHLGASVGVVVAPDDGTTTEQLRESVDLALYRAKQEGRARVCFFNADMDAAARDRRKIAGDLQKAVTAGDISLAYQPLVSTQTGQITSVEALARWTHAMRGPIRPDVFVPIAEECGLSTRWVNNCCTKPAAMLSFGQNTFEWLSIYRLCNFYPVVCSKP